MADKAKEKQVAWHVSARPLIDQLRTSVFISKKDDYRTYEIQLCPTVSLSVFFSEKEAKRQGSNHHIFGTIQVNNAKDFDDLWNAIAEALEKRKDMHQIKR